MRYEDASGSFSQAAAGTTDARNDEDALAAGSKGPATGNTITGAGTITGEAGADLIANAPGQIVALEGAGGSASGDGGSLHVEGRFGELTMNASGSYSYEPNAEVPNGGRDVFRYTLADAAGERDTATLTIDIGRELEKIDANAQQIIPGPDGVVTLPPGVQLSDVHVVGRNLVINMPDGTQMIIIDGAVFVPQLVLNGVEVPASNLAALLIEAEPRPAGGIPQSSGGNFEVPVPPLDPGVPLGDLIPPTELAFEPPIFEDIGQFIDQEPEILIQPDNQPASVAAVDSVNEAGLPTRNEGEPAGSGESADGNGADNDDPSEATTGVILIDSPDDPSVVTINGFVVTGVIGQVIPGLHGTLTITSVSDTAIGYLYTLTDNTTGDATHDDFIVTVTDNDGDQATATLTINIVDDVPTARPDTDSIAAGEFGPATGNVITDAAAGDIGDSDTNAADTVGADNATLTSVSGFGGSDSTFSEGALVVNGQYGVLTIEADGDYSYVRNPNTPGGVTDVFNYTLTDGDGDTSTSTLTINIADLPVTVGENEVVRTDDDAVPGANGNPGGTGDDVDAENLVGTLSGSGGDGTLTFAVQTTGAPAGFTYVSGGAGIVLVQQGGVTVLTVTVAANGDYSVVQNAPIDHAALGDENNTSFTINYRVTDLDGDFDDGTLTIDVDDDTPTISREDVSAPTLTVDETDLTTNATGDFSTLFDVSYGADGAGTTSYAVSVVNGTDSGLIDVATGESIFLFNNAGVVEGRVGGVGGVVAFTVAVNSTTGVVTLDQIRALDHPENPNPDDSVSPDPTSIQFTVNAVDGDGDPVSQTINIGGNLVFDDDGPSLTDVAAGAGVLLDETTAGSPAGFPISASSASAVISATAAFGADGPAVSGSLVYGLALAGGAPSVASGLQTAIGDFAITLVQIDADTIEGQYNGANVAFTIQMNADGTVTVTQNVPLEHLVDGPPGPAHDDPLDLNDLVSATVTITDRDGDPVSGSVPIGDNIVFEDDGPSINVTQSGEGAVVLTTQDAQTIGGASDTDVSTANFSGVFGVTSSGGADGAASVNTTYALAVSSSVSGLTSHGVAINLYNVGGVIVGSTSGDLAGINAGNTIFTVGVSATGVVTLTQHQQVDHALEGTTTSPFDDQFTVLADGKITLSASSTITDNDGDTASDSEVVDLGGNIRFADDGPDVSAVLTGTQIRIDETDGVVAAGGEVDPVGGNLGTVTVAAATLFTVSNPHVSADAPTTYAYALTLSSQGVASGLLLSTTNAPIFLYKIGGVVYGSTSATEAGVAPANTVFTASIDAGTGAVTLTQFFAVEHGNTASLDEDSSPLAAGALSVTVTATDYDGDTDSASVDLGSVIRFEDDGPTIDVTASADAGVLVQTQDPDTIGGATDTASSTANFGGVFGLTSNGGSDGAANTPTLSYTLGLSAPGVDSGLNQTGADIFLYVIGGKVVGSTSNTLLGVNAGNTVFDVAVSATGVVTLTQYSQIDHPIAGDPTPSATPFADHIISMTDSLVTLTASSSITDNDGDTVNDSLTINIGSNLQFGDHGPTATNDVDAIAAGFFGTATGNVLTGVEVAVAEDANGSDGNADNVGADTPGSITLIASNNVPANTDNSPDGAGNFVVSGQYGVLTINANGDYSYDRNDGSAGGVSDVFTYTLRDFDGDTVTATLTINIAVNPPVAGTENATVDDDGLVGSPNGVLEAGNGDINANLGETPATNASEAIYNGTLNVTGGDGAITFSLIAPANQAIGQETVSYALVANVLTATIATSPDATRVGDPLFTVSLDPATGNYVVTLLDNVLHNNDANEDEDGTEVSVNISYQTVDAGGHPSATPGTLTIQFNDDTPRATAALLTGTVDEDDVLEGADDGGPGDGITGGTGDIVLPPPETVTTGSVATLFTAGADAPLTYSLSAVTAALTAQGLTSGGVALTYNVAGDTLTASAGGGNTVFTFQLLANGNYTFTLVDQLDHPTLNLLAGDNTENELTIQLGSIIQATDADGDTVAAVTDADSGLIITVDDDMPAFGNANTIPLQVDNDDTPTATGTFAFRIGADENADFDDITVSNFAVSVNGEPLPVEDFELVEGSETATTASYTFSFDYDTGSGGTATATGTLVFNKADGTYTVALTNGPLQGFSILQTATGTGFTGYAFGSTIEDNSQPDVAVTQLRGDPDNPDPAFDLFVQFTSVSEPSSGTGDNNLEVTNWVPGADNPPPVDGGGDTSWSAGQLFNQDDGWVSASGNDNGVDGDTIQGGEVLDFTLVKGDNPQGILAQPVDFAQATTMFLKFDGISDSDTAEDLIVILKLYDPDSDTYTTRAIMIQNSDIQKGPGTGPGDFSGITLDNNDGLVIIEPNDYNGAGENWVIVGAQIAGSDEGVTGSAINLNPTLGAGGGSDTTGNFQDFSTDTNDGPLKISSIGFLTEDTNEQDATLTFDVTIEDYDGDAVTQAVTVNIGDTSGNALAASAMVVSQESIEDSSAFSLMASDSTDQYRTMSYANNNSVLLGAIAAAGLGAGSQAAAHNFASGGHEMLIDTSSFGYVGGDMQGFVIDSVDTVRSALDGEMMEVVGFESFVDTSSHGSAITEKLSLTDGAGETTLAPTALLQGTEAIGMELAQSTLTSAAVGMPSAEMLVAGGDGLSVAGAPQTNGEVGRVLFDALAGGDGGANIDAVLDAVTNSAGGGNAGLQAIASHVGGDVSPWHMADFAGYSAGHSANMMETMALQPDAVHTAA